MLRLKPGQHGPRASVMDRLRAYSVESSSGCWLWQLKIDKNGYGRMAVGGKTVLAHRAAYEAFVGPIPDGLVIDHLCHTRDRSCAGASCVHRRCVNPDHLDVVTPGENTRRGRSLWAINARKTHCKNGHEFTSANTYVWNGGRYCRTCNRAAVARRKARKAARR
jgi:hypothetical protein